MPIFTRYRTHLFLALVFISAACTAQPVIEGRQARQAVEKFSSGCAIAQTLDEQGQPVFFWQQEFEDGSHDLAMARTEHGKLLQVRRVTYGGSKQPGCHYPSVAIARGGVWGWHLAWSLAGAGAGKPALRYARMDGAAWVSSPPKRFGNATAHDPQLLLGGGRLKLTWQETVDGKPQEKAATSEDEGRSWH